MGTDRPPAPASPRTLDGDDSLALDADTMRRLAQLTVELLIAELGDQDASALRRGDPADLAARLGGPPPEQPEDFAELLARLRADVLPFMARGFHPGFFAFVPSSGTWPGVLGDLIASALNIHAGAWMVGAGPAQLELEVLGWFQRWVGYPAGAGGILVSGGSVANMTALACARERLAGAMRPDLVAYVADQAHSSLPRAARVLGFRPEQVRVLPVDDRFRMIPRLLAAAIDADLRHGRRPLFVSASGGATNTGAVDPLPELAAICRERGVWLHVDAAYGGFATLTARGAAALTGLGLADSITLDPHKWLHQPYECGCVLVREERALRATFAMTPEYLDDARAGAAGEVNFADHGIQLTRAARCLKVWLSIRTFGLAAFRAAIDRSLDLAELAAARIERSPALELTAPPSLGVVCFRRRLEAVADEEARAAVHARLAAALEATGRAVVSSTRLRGRATLRMCVLNHGTRAEDVEAALTFLETAAVAGAPLRASDREYPLHAEAGASWPAVRSGERCPDPAALRELGPFASLSVDEATRAAALALLRDVAPGETVVEQWEVSRDWFVVLAGGFEVSADGAPLRTLRRGDMFGEIAAVEWARGYGYPRTASVTASEPARLAVFPDGAVNALMRELPALRRRVLAALHDRLPRS